MATWESEKELAAKAKRVNELEGLIAEASRLMELAKGVDSPERMNARRKERALLMQERLWYQNGHAFKDWPAFQSQMAERERAAADSSAAKSKLEAERQAEADKKVAEHEAALRKEFEESQDAFLQWKRSKASRTFDASS